MIRSFISYTISYVVVLSLILFFIYIMRYLGFVFQDKLTEKLKNKSNVRKLDLLILAPGVIVHELSHAIMALIFSYKINKISLFNPDLDTNVLGYVEYETKPGGTLKKILQIIGNPLIGIAPLFGISIITIIIYRMFFDDGYVDVKYELFYVSQSSVFSLFQTCSIVFVSILKGFLSFSGFFKGIIFLVILAILSSGMALSDADINNSKIGFPALIATTFITGLIFNYIIPSLNIIIMIFINISLSLSILLIIFQCLLLFLMFKFIK